MIGAFLLWSFHREHRGLIQEISAMTNSAVKLVRTTHERQGGLITMAHPDGKSVSSGFVREDSSYAIRSFADRDEGGRYPHSSLKAGSEDGVSEDWDDVIDGLVSGNQKHVDVDTDTADDNRKHQRRFPKKARSSFHLRPWHVLAFLALALGTFSFFRIVVPIIEKKMLHNVVF